MGTEEYNGIQKAAILLIALRTGEVGQYFQTFKRR